MEGGYTNKVGFIGIDVHKKSYSVYCVCEGARVKSWNMGARAKELIGQLKEYFSGAELCKRVLVVLCYKRLLILG
ncbi:hypothetical protein [Legionella nagasakiensis]|uniref:hypothetical protein n=1 Tax=Legionella nagasakiensis TaxID=535290 RepID=UPI00105543BF|nr:hypothetical protein [Legionella nagasakiensis]